MRFCSKCGAQCEDNMKYCESCGYPLDETSGTTNVPNAQPTPSGMIENRSIALALILSIITCGIYSIYWMIKLNDEINQLSGETQATSGGMVFLLSLITCGIYGLYWMYKMGERCDRIKGTNGSSGILYLILSLFGFGIVSYCLMQDTINKAL